MKKYKPKYKPMFDEMEAILQDYLDSDFCIEARTKFYKRIQWKSRRWLQYCVVYGIGMVMNKMVKLVEELEKLKQKEG